MKLIPVIALVLIITFTRDLHAQPYEHSLGIRAGYSSGITYKGFFRHSLNAVQVDALYNRHGLNLSVLYQVHIEPLKSKQWLLFAGGGPFGGNWENELSLGIAVVGGIEYTLRDLPLSFSIDWKPMMNAYRLFEIDFLDFGVSIRYRFSL